MNGFDRLKLEVRARRGSCGPGSRPGRATGTAQAGACTATGRRCRRRTRAAVGQVRDARNAAWPRQNETHKASLRDKVAFESR